MQAVLAVVYSCECPSGFEPGLRFDANVTREYFCKPCDPGYKRARGVDLDSCVPCPEGMLAMNGSRCEFCPGNTYAPTAAARECLYCPAG